jgi:hypothetical protein
MDLAKASRVFEGRGLEPGTAVAIITFEAIAMAMPHVNRLPIEERAFALDQATVLLDARRADLEAAFDEVPAFIESADDAAVTAITEARRCFAWTIVWEGPGTLCMPAVDQVPSRASDAGMVAMMLPGTLALPGEPVAWWLGRDEPMLARGVAGCRAMPLDEAVQVWRVFDQAGAATADVVRCADDDGPDGGVPLIVPRLLDARRLEVPQPDAGWPPFAAETLGSELPPVRWDAPRLW